METFIDSGVISVTPMVIERNLQIKKCRQK